MQPDMYISAVGTDPVFSVLLFWFLAMAMHPDVQERAQRELDEVVGHKRVPGFADMPRLPYIKAMVKEIIRWSSVIPPGVYVRIELIFWFTI